MFTRVWLSTTETCEWLGISRETLRRLRLRGVFQPGKHFRHWGCTQSRGPLQWYIENVEVAITGWSKRNLRGCTLPSPLWHSGFAQTWSFGQLLER